MGGKEFLSTLNRAFVVFRKDEQVIDNLTKVLDGATYEKPGPEEMNRRITKVYKSMCTNLKVKPLEEHVFQRPFKSTN